MGKYEEALERAKAGKPLDEVFPELKESEDERIRKEIKEALQTIYARGAMTEAERIGMKDWIAYLEKQKEPENISASTMISSCWAEEPSLQKDQNPAEYEKPLLSKFEQAVYDCAWRKVTCKPEGETQEEYAKRWAEQFLSMVRDWAEDYIDSQIESAKRKAYDRGKADVEKPAEWSEEDKMNLNGCICSLRQYGYMTYADFLNHLPERFSLQSKLVAWSEEDEKMLDIILTDINYAQKNHSDSKLTPYGKKVSWLKNRLKSLRPQPHWKPSGVEIQAIRTAIYILTEERNFQQAGKHLKDILAHYEGSEPGKDWKPSKEQMEALKEAVNDSIMQYDSASQLKEEITRTYSENLQSLLNDLKKL